MELVHSAYLAELSGGFSYHLFLYVGLTVHAALFLGLTWILFTGKFEKRQRLGM